VLKVANLLYPMTSLRTVLGSVSPQGGPGRQGSRIASGVVSETSHTIRLLIPILVKLLVSNQLGRQKSFVNQNKIRSNICFINFKVTSQQGVSLSLSYVMPASQTPLLLQAGFPLSFARIPLLHVDKSVYLFVM
jgi:hypothetical protein